MNNYGRGGLRRRRSSHTSGKVIRKISLSLLQIILLVLLAGIIFGCAFGIRTVRSVIAEAPEIDSITVAPTQAATYIYNQEGKREQKLTLPESNRDIVTIDSIPKDLQHAFVAIEDSRFYTHNGIDPQGIVRAFWIGVTSGSFSEGASTITQQLLKNTVFTGWTQESGFQDRLRRKIQEQYLAVKLEKILDKDQILEDYLNVINLGAGCYGVQAASYRYFGKDVSELTLSESTVIAGITQNPTRYNPITNPEDNASRRKKVLRNMLEQEFISQSQYEDALADNVYDRIQSNEQAEASAITTSIYSYYQDALIDQVIQDLQEKKAYTYQQAYKAVYTGGLRIFSAQDKEIQQICDSEFENASNFPEGTQVGIDYALSIETTDGEITNYGNDDLRRWVRQTSDPAFDLMYGSSADAKASAQAFRESVVTDDVTVLGERITVTPQPQASVVVIDQSTGYVQAIVGGRGNKDASLTLNRATYTTRQPGSTFKILTTYAPALDAAGKTLASVYDNEATTYSDGTKVNNWDLNNYTGPTTIREAIVRSINVVAVRAIQEITPAVGYDYATKLGISTLVESMISGNEILSDKTEALALGGITKGVTNLDLCGAYAGIANLGHYIEPKFYSQVLDNKGNVVLDNSKPISRSVLKESTAALLTSAMEGVISDPEGTAYGIISMNDAIPVAGKSGTTSDYRDIWFAGYTPYYTMCVWGGYDNNSVLPTGDIGHTYNKVLWNSIMNRINSAKELRPIAFSKPSDGLIQMQVCTETGMAASSGCPSQIEWFANGSQPSTYCDTHGDGSAVPADVFAGLTDDQVAQLSSYGVPIAGSASFTLPGTTPHAWENYVDNGDTGLANGAGQGSALPEGAITIFDEVPTDSYSDNGDSDWDTYSDDNSSDNGELSPDAQEILDDIPVAQ